MDLPINYLTAPSAALLALLCAGDAGALGHYDGNRLSVPEVHSDNGTVFRDVLLERRGTRFTLRRAIAGNALPDGYATPVGLFSGASRLLHLPEVAVELGGSVSYHDLELRLAGGAPPIAFEVEAVSPPLETEPPQEHRLLRELLEQAVAEGLVGVSLAVRGAGMDFSASAGFADLARGRPMTPEHKLQFGSIAKMLLGATMAQMQEQGLVELDAPITRWLEPAITDRIPDADTTTLRHLLTHTSGLFDYNNDSDQWDQALLSDPDRHWTLREILEFALDRPSYFKPGTRFGYSNTNYLLAGLILERVTGRPYYEAIRRRVLRPLGLEDTFNTAEMFLATEAAHGYLVDEDTGERIDGYPVMSRLSRPDSGMFGTPENLVVLIRGLLDSDRVLNQRSRTQFLTPPVLPQGSSGYGLGIGHGDLGAGLGRIYGHEGQDFGYRANLYYMERTGLSIALCANSAYDPASDAAFARLFERIVVLLLEGTAAGVEETP